MESAGRVSRQSRSVAGKQFHGDVLEDHQLAERSEKLVERIFQTVRSARRHPAAVTDFWIQRILGRSVSPAAREELVLFMASGRNPDMELLFETDGIAAERLWALIALLMMSPENIQK